MSEISDTLTGNYLLVDYTGSRWSARKTDKKASNEVTTANGARSDSARVVKDLMAGARDELKAVGTSQDAIRNYVYSVTLPWSTNQGKRQTGARLLPVADSFEFMQNYKQMVETALTITVL